MKAIRIHAFGHSDQLKLEDVERPALGPSAVLVRIFDAGVNPVDWKIREGERKDRFPVDFPAIVGQDFAGEIEQVGDAVFGFAPGDAVYGFAPGAYAEYAAVPVDHLALKPKSIDFVAASSVPTAALTAWQALIDHGELQRGQSVLVHGAGGGVGSLACQIAKWKGAKVIANATQDDRAYLEALGADVILDYKQDRFEERIKDVDLVLDLIGGETQRLSFEVMNKGGILVSTVGQVDQALVSERGLRGKAMVMRRDGKQLAEIAELIDLGYLAPRLSGVYNLHEAAQAQDFLRDGHPHGKVVIRVC